RPRRAAAPGRPAPPPPRPGPREPARPAPARPPPRPATPAAQTPPIPQATPATPGSLVAWSREQLAEIERQLLPLVGPMARILVRDAAATTARRQELYQLLARHP